MNDVPDAASTVPARPWPGVVSIAAGAFAMVFAELLPVGLLSGISRDLHVLEGTAGMIVSITALLAFIAAPATALAAGRIDRRVVLLVLTLLTVVSSLISVAAPDFTVLFAGRVLLGIALGGFWAVAVPAAARLVPANKEHVASTAVMSGISIAAVIAVPAGALIGTYFDWRVAFIAATVIPLVVLLLQWHFLPAIKMDDKVAAADLVAVLQSPRNMASMLTMACAVAGHYAAYTFVTPYLSQVGGMTPALLGTLLFAYGVCSIAGNFIGGALAARSRHATVLGNMLAFIVALVLIAVSGGNSVVLVGAVLLWAIVWGIVPVSIQLWVFGGARQKPEAVGAVLVSIFQMAISIGSFLGGLAVNGVGIGSVMWLGATLVTVGVGAVILVGRFDSHPAGNGSRRNANA